MKNQDAFSEYHPLVNFLFFGVLFGFSMFSMHPVCLAVSFVSSFMYYCTLKGSHATALLLKGVLPLLLFTMIINPAFSHEGETILCYLPTGNPLTLESILYGVAAGFMLTSILIWFSCFSEVVTSDKFVYLFGSIVPALSLLLSMTLRFVPRFKAQFDTVNDVQSMLGRDTRNGGILNRVKNMVSCFSIVITWSLENAVETADSMKSRGYGTEKRTAYSIYRFTDRDKTALLFIVFCALFLSAGILSGKLNWSFFPKVRGVLSDRITITLQFVYLCLCLMPFIIDRKEEITWKHLRSSI